MKRKLQPPSPEEFTQRRELLDPVHRGLKAVFAALEGLDSNVRNAVLQQLATGIEQYWTTEQVADRLHVPADTVSRWLYLRELRRTKAGAKTLISETDLQDFLRRSTDKASVAA